MITQIIWMEVETTTIKRLILKDTKLISDQLTDHGEKTLMINSHNCIKGCLNLLPILIGISDQLLAVHHGTILTQTIQVTTKVITLTTLMEIRTI
mgnify:CR=1 FL=1